MLTWDIEQAAAADGRAGFTLVIGDPEWGRQIDSCWSCEITAPHIRDRPFRIFGATPIQALSLSLELVRDHLEKLAETGDLSDPLTGEALPAGLFGRAGFRGDETR